jgi:hypothetical protein
MIAQSARVLVFTAFVLAIFLFAPQLAFAQAPAPAGGGGSGAKPPPKKTTVNFEDQLIEGQTAKPELFYLLQQRSPNFKRLIKLRENFIPEMQDTAEDMNRAGSDAKGH